MTKPITSLCIFQLIERGFINLETDIEDISEKYKNTQIINSFEANNPVYTNPTNKIKIKHLLNHTAGYGYEIWDKKINELVNLKLLNSLFDDDSGFLNAPILFNPGSAWKYGINIDVRGDLVENITNQKLGTFMNENIFKQINMTKTSFDLTKEDFENIAIKYSINKNNEYFIEDDELEFDTEYFYRVSYYVDDWSDYSDTVSVILEFMELDNEQLPIDYALHQNYPNPFNPLTNLSYDLPKDSRVKLTIYNTMGNAVKTLVSEQQSAGKKILQWDATNDLGQKVSAGLYIYTIKAESFSDTKKMILLK